MYVDMLQRVDGTLEIAVRLLFGGDEHRFTGHVVMLRPNQLVESTLARKRAGSVLWKLALKRG
jgi:hypothetical protein